MNPKKLINSLQRLYRYCYTYGFKTAWGYIAVPYIYGIKSLPIKHKTVKDYLYRWSKQQGIDLTTVSSEKNIASASNLEKIPIWVCWLQGEDQMPEVVKICYESLKRNCPENCKIQLITEKHLHELLDIPPFITHRLKIGSLSRTHFSDYIRIALLNRYGGIWIDATIYVSKQFEVKLNDNQLFTIKSSKVSDTFVSDYRWSVSLIGCNKGNILFAKLQQLMESYIFSHKEFIDFFLFDYFIAILYDQNEAIRLMIDSVEVNNEGFYELSKIINSPEKNLADKYLSSQSFHKLSWKTRYYKTTNGKPTIYSELLRLNSITQRELTPAISVVMPAYNAGAYLADTINSIIHQDFQDFELIIADDCSTDNTANIVQSFCDSRIRLIKTEKNSGSAKYPRELAIEAAKAPLICWIYSDDTVSSDYLSKLYQRKLESGADIVCSQMIAERNGMVEYTLPISGFDYDKILTGKEACLLTLSFPWEINLNGWLCDREQWVNVSTFMSLTINHMDADDFSAREILFNAPKVAFSPAQYHYRLHPDAITKKVSPKLFESVVTWELLYKYFQDHWPEVIPTIKDSMCKRMIALLRLYVIHENKLTEMQRMESRKLLKEYFKKIGVSRVYVASMPFAQKLIMLMPFDMALHAVRIINKKSA